MIDNIVDHILKAKEEAIKKGIEANAIIIDKDIAYSEMLYTDYNDCYHQNMILGLKIEYSTHPLPFDANFLLFRREYVDEKENKAKAFDIINEKDVDTGWLKRADSLEKYNRGMGINSYCALTEEEYDLLRSMLWKKEE